MCIRDSAYTIPTLKKVNGCANSARPHKKTVRVNGWKNMIFSQHRHRQDSIRHLKDIIADSVVRIIPGAIGDEASALTDSFQDNLLAPPVYMTGPVGCPKRR